MLASFVGSVPRKSIPTAIFLKIEIKECNRKLNSSPNSGPTTKNNYFITNGNASLLFPIMTASATDSVILITVKLKVHMMYDNSIRAEGYSLRSESHY